MLRGARQISQVKEKVICFKRTPLPAAQYPVD